MTMQPILRAVGIYLLITVLSIEPVKPSVELRLIDNIYLPSKKGGKLCCDVKAVRDIAYDVKRNTIYAVGKEVFHIIQVLPPGMLELKKTVYDKNDAFTSVAVCGDHVIMTVDDLNDPEKGEVRVYSVYDENQPVPFELITKEIVGYGPAHLAVRQSCESVVVAVEGEAYEEDKKLKNPKGKIVIIHFPEGLNTSVTQSTDLDFKDFHDRYVDDLKPMGVRFVYDKDGNKFSDDVEPEYVTIAEETGKAYVSLQENNAVAEVDLKTETITAIHGLGYKQWGHLDASDKDSGINIKNWPIRAWYQPDALVYRQWNGYGLIFTANEGGVKEYESKNFKDFDETTSKIKKKDLGDEIDTIVKEAIQDNEGLGRLKFSRYEGLDKDGKYQALYTYGGRSFSIWRLTQTDIDSTKLSQVYDSGSDFEQNTASYCPHLFNMDEDKVDKTSDNKGPEPESLALAEINGRLYIFIGNERPGTIMVYSIGSDPSDARFETIFCEGIPDDSRSMKELFKDRVLYGVDPEEMIFYPADQSPTGRPILMVAGVVSSSVTLLDVVVTDDDRVVPTATTEDALTISARNDDVESTTTTDDALTTQASTTSSTDSGITSKFIDSGLCPQNLVDNTESVYLQTFETFCFYFAVHHARDYHEANDRCSKFGGNLAMPKTEPINNYLIKELTTYYKYLDPVWIGLDPTNANNDTVFWSDAARVDWTQYADDVDCIALDPKTGTWIDYDCGTEVIQPASQNAYICQFSEPHDALECPPFDCTDLDCQMDGYKLNENRCQICECNV